MTDTASCNVRYVQPVPPAEGDIHAPLRIVHHGLPAGRAAVAATALLASALAVSSPAAAQTLPFTDISQDAYSAGSERPYTTRRA